MKSKQIRVLLFFYLNGRPQHKSYCDWYPWHWQEYTNECNLWIITIQNKQPSKRLHIDT